MSNVAKWIAIGVVLTVGSVRAEEAPIAAQAERGGLVWSPELLHDPGLWQEGARDRATVGADGVRLTVGESRTWELVAQSGITLPERTGAIRVRVADLEGGAKWFLKLRGDLRGTGRIHDVVPFYGCVQKGEFVREIDPRLLRPGRHSPLQVQLGLEGPPGAWVRFESVEFLAATPSPARRVEGQENIETVDRMPNLPQPYEMRDWQALAREYDRLVFDLNATGEYLPLLWIDHGHINTDQPTFGLSSYVGDGRPARAGSDQEGVTCLGAVLGATVAGIDKSRQEHDYVRMCEAFFNPRNGQNLVLNLQDARSGGSFWYEIWPHVVFYALADRYPQNARLTEVMRITADRWHEAVGALKQADGVPDFNYTAFDMASQRPVDNRQWKEPDGAAGVAWLEYAAWTRLHDPRHLEAAEDCVRFLERCPGNPYYEVLLPWGALAAARMNAELGREHDTGKLIRWCFDVSDCRPGWGVVVGNWGGYDCSGLVGSIEDRGGYAFAMNTFAQAGALVPLVRYDARYGRAIGKWMLNLANAARLFYPHQHPPDRQSSAFWKGDPAGVIAYEALRCQWEGMSPYATGDPVVLHWGPKTDLGLYGSSYAGLLGGIVRTSGVPGILQLDCLATDFHRQEAYPTYLYYNPHPTAQEVPIGVGEDPCDLYDAATHCFVARGVTGSARFPLAADTAAVLVVVPSGQPATQEGRKRIVEGVVIDYALPSQ